MRKLLRRWTDDPQARKIFAYAKEKADGHPILPRYTVSDVPAHTIVDLAVNVGVSIVSFFVVIRKGDSNASIRVLENLMKPSELLEVS